MSFLFRNKFQRFEALSEKLVNGGLFAPNKDGRYSVATEENLASGKVKAYNSKGKVQTFESPEEPEEEEVVVDDGNHNTTF